MTQLFIPHLETKSKVRIHKNRAAGEICEYMNPDLCITNRCACCNLKTPGGSQPHYIVLPKVTDLPSAA